MADWKGFKEQAVATYEASVTFLNEIAEQIPKIAQVRPSQVQRVQKRFKASGKAKVLAEEVDLLRQVELNGSVTQAREVMERIQKTLRQLEKDLSDRERDGLHEVLSGAYPNWDKPVPITHGATLPRVAVEERPARMDRAVIPGEMSKAIAPPPRRRRIVFQKISDVPTQEDEPPKRPTQLTQRRDD